MCRAAALLQLGVFYSPNVANSASALFLSVSSLISTSVFRSYERMPVFIRSISYATFFKYASQVRVKMGMKVVQPSRPHAVSLTRAAGVSGLAQVMIVNEFEDLQLTCDDTEPCRYPSGNFYLRVFYPTAVDTFIRDVSLSVAFVVLAFFSAWFALLLRPRSLR